MATKIHGIPSSQHVHYIPIVQWCCNVRLAHAVQMGVCWRYPPGITRGFGGGSPTGGVWGGSPPRQGAGSGGLEPCRVRRYFEYRMRNPHRAHRKQLNDPQAGHICPTVRVCVCVCVCNPNPSSKKTAGWTYLSNRPGVCG